MTKIQNRLLTWTLYLLIIQVIPVFAQNNWEYPRSLTPDVEFWKSVFTLYSKNQYILHDSENLNIIYKVITFDSTYSDHQREKHLEKIKDEIKGNLLQLAEESPKTSAGNHFENYLLEIFGNEPDPNLLRKVSKRIRAQQGMRDGFEEGLSRSLNLLPFMKEIFKQYSLPEELAYLPHIESSFHPLAKSRVGAAGMWQFMRSTGRLYMKVNSIIDERYDPLISTRAAARLLLYNYQQIGEWGLAITAYNFGLAGIKRAVRVYGPDYLAVRESFNHRKFKFASRNFYPEFLAVLEIMQDYQKYFPEIRPQESSPTVRYQLKKRLKFRQLAKYLGISVTDLQLINPAYSDRAVKGRVSIPAGYWVNIPALSDLVKLEMDIEQIEPNENEEIADKKNKVLFQISSSETVDNEKHLLDPPLNSGENLVYQKPGVIPEISVFKFQPDKWPEKPVGQPDTHTDLLAQLEKDIMTHLDTQDNQITVFANETLGHYADWLGVSLSHLQKLNKMGRRRTIYQGQTLKLDFSRVSKEDFNRKRYNFHADILKSFLDKKEFVNLVEYQVSRGESVWELARYRYQVPLEIIQYFNINVDINRLYPGDILRIPTFQNFNSLEETL
jgi:membrane-bound lytic murein transglycosylase D